MAAHSFVRRHGFLLLNLLLLEVLSDQIRLRIDIENEHSLRLKHFGTTAPSTYRVVLNLLNRRWLEDILFRFSSLRNDQGLGLFKRLVISGSFLSLLL